MSISGFDAESSDCGDASKSKMWSFLRIDESSQASCLRHPAINPHFIDTALTDSQCTSVSTVLVLYTGGTIGMGLVNGAYEPVPNFLVKSLIKMPTLNDPNFERLKRQLPSDNFIRNLSAVRADEESQALIESNWACSNTTFALPLTKDCRRVFYSIAEYTPLLDSSDMTMDDWVRIARDIKTYYDFFDGFIVLHGTDTLAYTAAALSYMLENLGKPVVITGSQLPIFELRSDGWNNFLGALLVAGGGYPLQEVTVFFHDRLFRGSRVVKRSSSEFHAFDSPNYPPLAKCETDLVFFLDLLYRPVGEQQPFRIHTELCRDVTVVNIFPSITANHVATLLAPPTKGAVLRAYGAGNVPASRKDLLAIFEAAKKRGVLMICVTQCYRGGVKAIYSTGMILNEYGVLPGYDITTEAALTKLAYVLGKKEWPDPATKREMLLRSLRGEVTIHGEDAQTAKLYQSKHLHTERSLISFFADLFTEAQTGKSDGRGLMWANRLISALVCTAAASNDLASLEEIYRIVGHLQFSDSDGCSPLHKSVRHGHISATKFLLEHGVAVHTKDLWGMTALDYATESPGALLELVQILVNAGARFSQVGLASIKAVNRAAAMGDINRLRLYRLAGCSFDKLDFEGRNALHVAVANRQLETVKFLISPKHASEGPFMENGCTDNCDYATTNCENFHDGGGMDPTIPTGWGTTAIEEAKLRLFDEIVYVLSQTAT